MASRDLSSTGRVAPAASRTRSLILTRSTPEVAAQGRGLRFAYRELHERGGVEVGRFVSAHRVGGGRACSTVVPGPVLGATGRAGRPGRAGWGRGRRRR